jgi:hypothetical protein
MTTTIIIIVAVLAGQWSGARATKKEQEKKAQIERQAEEKKTVNKIEEEKLK